MCREGRRRGRAIATEPWSTDREASVSRNHLSIAVAAALVIVGLFCMIYALVQVQDLSGNLSPRPVAAAAVRDAAADEAEESASDADRDGETPSSAEAADRGDTSDDGAPDRRDNATLRAAESAARPASSDADSDGRPSQASEKTRESFVRTLATHGLMLTLGLIVLVVVVALVLRRFRPVPRHHGPTDTTDLWREAGRRLK